MNIQILYLRVRSRINSFKPVYGVLWIWTITSSVFMMLVFFTGFCLGEEKSSQEKPQNPHFDENACSACHENGNRKSMTLSKAEKICLSCHQDRRIRMELHPTDVVSHKGKKKLVPKEFPLIYGSLGCVTCHDAKAQCTVFGEGKPFNPSFLRGGPYVHPHSICYRCHKIDYYELFDPHKQFVRSNKVNKDVCFYCHEKTVKRNGDALAVGKFIEGVCFSCHRGLSHIPGANHMQRPNAEMRAHIRSIEKNKGLYLPLNSKNEVFCATCHNPHEKSIFPKGDVRGIGAEGEKPLRHRVRVPDGVICVVCHQTKQEAGNSLPRNQDSNFSIENTSMLMSTKKTPAEPG